MVSRSKKLISGKDVGKERGAERVLSSRHLTMRNEQNSGQKRSLCSQNIANKKDLPKLSLTYLIVSSDDQLQTEQHSDKVTAT